MFFSFPSRGLRRRSRLQINPSILSHRWFFLRRQDERFLQRDFGPSKRSQLRVSISTNFSSLCEWFIDNKLSIHLCKDKTKSILFGTKLNIKRAELLNIVYGNFKIKQYTKVTYLFCILDESLSGESMALYVLNKINPRLRFLYRQKWFLKKPLWRLLSNANDPALFWLRLPCMVT